ncbi:carbohydrate-binding protein [Rathayibacter sp. AY1F3]|uniref:carbohydrate-binding protein n=1 Tax=Rathayibacter sp. AY1F3 TaxID=2080558 RepID=UPI0015E431FA|nr:carbohydrate-binding protein [Rathayibacter sp. AY1F3]
MKPRIVIAAAAIAALASAGLTTGALATSAVAAPSGTTVSVTQTALAADRLATKTATTFGSLNGAVPDIRIDAAQQHQAIDGFGATFNEAGWDVLNRPSVSAAQRGAVMDQLFDPGTGAGFSIARTSIGSNDFALDHYSYDETDGDFGLNDFSVARDQQYLIPYIKAAQASAGGPFRLMASPWTAPSWLKNNKSLLGKPTASGDASLVAPSVDPRYYQAYADYFAKYVAAYKQQGIDVTDVSVQNEPENPASFEATLWTDSQMAQFVGSYLGPTFAAQSTGTKIRVYEHNQDHWYYPSNVLNDPAVKPYASGADFHPYECDFGQNYCSDANLDLFAQSSPGYSSWMSEHTDLGQAEPTNYIRDEKWAKEIVKQINHGQSAYIYWNMVLDQNGGPVTDLSAPQEPLVEVDTSGSAATVSYMPKFYELAQFSKFVKPGAHRIGAEGGLTGDDVAQTAFENPDGSRVLVVVNSGPATTATVGEGTTGFTAKLQAHSTSTYTWAGAKSSYALSPGATAGYSDIASEHFTGDSGLVSGGATAQVAGDIANTADDTLYRTTRTGAVSYALPVPNGRYRVSLLLSENAGTAAGQNVFDVTAEGATAFSGVDPFAAGSGARSASTASAVVAVSDGTLNLATVARQGTPSLAGVRVSPLPATGDAHRSTVTGGLASGYSTNAGVLPGVVFAQDYNDGGSGVGYSIAQPQSTTSGYRPDAVNLATSTDTTYGGGEAVVGLASGDRLNYTVDVVAGGRYDLALRLRTTNNLTGGASILLDGQPLATLPASTTAGAWADRSVSGVTLPAGTHTLTVVASGLIDLRTLTASRITDITAGSTIEAEDWAAGGEGTGYHDTTAGNGNTTYRGLPLVGYYRGGDVDLESSSVESSQGDNFDVGGTDDGEWLRYDVHADSAGAFDISARVASGFDSGVIAYALDDRSNIVSPADTTIPNTNGWQTWRTQVVQNVPIPAGTHALYVLVKKGGFNLDRLTVVPTGMGWATTVGFGSSYAAGPGVSTFTDQNARQFIKSGGVDRGACQRSRWNQVQYLADRFGQRDTFYDASCPSDTSQSIATSTGQGDELAEAATGYAANPWRGAGALGWGTKTVTVSVGGNDVYSGTNSAGKRYEGTVTGAMYACDRTTSCVDGNGVPNWNGTKGGTRKGDITVAAMKANLKPIVEQILAATKKDGTSSVQIRFISYPSVFGRPGTSVSCSGAASGSDPAWSYTAAESTYLQNLLDTLTTTEASTLTAISSDLGLPAGQLRLVDIRSQSEDHGICQPQSTRWIAQPYGDSSAAGIHPNLSMFAMEARQVSLSSPQG